MPIIEATTVEEVMIPEGCEIVLAETGVVAGIRLPNGEFLKPWINWELFASSDENEDAIGDLDESELNERDVYTGLDRSEEHTSELQSLMRISYAVFCLKKKNTIQTNNKSIHCQHTKKTHI